MREDRYIDVLVTEDMLEDPEEACIHPLVGAVPAIQKNCFLNELPYYHWEFRSCIEPKYRANFPHSEEPPRKGQGKKPNPIEPQEEKCIISGSHNPRK